MLRPALLAALAAAVAILPAAAPLALPALPGSGGASGPPSLVGQWGLPFDGEVAAVSMAVLHDGSVVYWSGVEAAQSGAHSDEIFFLDGAQKADYRVLKFNPDGSVDSISRPAGDSGGDLFCAGLSILPDGRVLSVGGTEYTSLDESVTWDVLYGLKDARIFDPATDTWSRAADMIWGRWYPSIIGMADGNALVASGITTLTSPVTQQPFLERYDAQTNEWGAVGQQLLPLYPRLTVVPSGPMKGEVFYSTVSTLWGPFGEHPLEGLWSLQQVYDPASMQWRYLGPSEFGARQHGAAVLLPLDPADGYRAKIFTFGGSLQRSVAAIHYTEMADLGLSPGDPVRNAIKTPMNHARWHLNGVLLPDGNVLAVGGGLYDNVVAHGQPNVPVLPAEEYNPATDTWTELPAMQVPRMYHSTAVLLPDGRVLVGGHVPLPVPWKDVRDNLNAPDAANDDNNPLHVHLGESQVQETRLEIYEPNYLHRGPRPVIVDAPAGNIGYGTSFDVDVAGAAAAITSAVLVKPGATTHSFDADQREVRLTIQNAAGNTLRLTAPPDSAVAPPGYYMLFVGTGSGDTYVPSVATFVHIA